jgi:hypothetical protein
VESIWPKFRPARHWANDSPDASAIQHTWRAAAESLFACHRDFTIIDSRTLAESKVDAGVLVHGQLRWRAVVLPGIDTLPGAAWENLERFVRSGGVVIALRALPMNSETEFPSPKIRSLGRKMFGVAGAEVSMITQGKDGVGVFLPAGSEGLLPIILDGVLERDVTVYGARSAVRATHRRIDGREVYFLINDSSKAWQGDVSVSARGPGERWDPAIGAVAQADLGQRLSLNLEPYGATLLRYPAARLPQKRPPQGGVLPNLAQRVLPDAKPALAQGEFVRAEVLPDPVHSQPGRPAWRASARLTKSQVDTFLFVRFLFPEPLDLTGTECLVVDAWVPDGQQTSAQLLAIVQEKDGGDFLSDTGCLLGASGHHRVFVPISRLQLAGWSQDSDGELDLKRVSEVRIGWGGYLGTEGERVEFSVALPQTGSIDLASSRAGNTHPR